MNIEQQLQLLAQLQKIDSEIFGLKKYQGDLPRRIEELETEYETLNLKKEVFIRKINDLEASIAKGKKMISLQKHLLKNRKEALENVRTDKEFRELEAEIELIELEIENTEEKIKKNKEEIERIKASKKEMQETPPKKEKKEETLAEIEELIAIKYEEIKTKRSELSKIRKETREEEEKLLKIREKLVPQLPENLYAAYENLRRKSTNRLAVVGLDRDACGGCFILLPPQKVYEVRLRASLFTCESCGRFIVDPTLFGQEEYWNKRETHKKKTKKGRISKKQKKGEKV